MVFGNPTSIGKLVSVISKGIVTIGSSLLGMGAGGAVKPEVPSEVPPEVPPDVTPPVDIIPDLIETVETMSTTDVLIVLGIGMLAIYGLWVLIRGR
jgi:hypothetical protein